MLTNFGCCMTWVNCTHVRMYTCIMVSGQLMGGIRGNCADTYMWYCIRRSEMLYIRICI